MGSMTTNKVDYPSMLAGYGDFGALQRINYVAANASNTTNPISFSNIPQTFQDLRLVVYGRATDAATTQEIAIALNNNGSAVYSRTWIIGDGSSATSGRATSQSFLFTRFSRAGANATSGIFGVTTIDILNYANTSTNKTVLVRGAVDLNGSGNTSLSVHLFQSTSAISSIDLYSNGGNWTFGSTAALYGVRSSAV